MKKFIKWTADDCEHVGQHVSTKNNMITMMLSCGVTVSFPTDDGVVADTTKPNDWGSVSIAPDVSPTTKKVTRTTKKGSKKEKALIIVQDLFGKGHGKDATIQRLIDVLEMSPAGAQTYFYNAKRELGL